MGQKENRRKQEARGDNKARRKSVVYIQSVSIYINECL